MTLAASLRQRPRADLEVLLASRPELLERPPASWQQLAQRTSDWKSVHAALDQVDLFGFQLLDALMLLGDGVPRGRLDAFVGGLATPSQLEAGLDRLENLALAWRDGSRLRHNEGLRYVLPGSTAGLPAARLVTGLPGQQLEPVLGRLGLGAKGRVSDQRQRLLGFLTDRKAVAARLDEAPASVGDLLRLLVTTGSRISAFPTGDDPRRAEALGWLRDRGMLLPVDWQFLELPRELHDVMLERLRLARLDPTPPELTGPVTDAARADGSAVHAMTETVLAVERLTEALEAEPPALLKNGGMGVRELKRLACRLHRTEHEVSALLELAAAAGLVQAVLPPTAPAPRTRPRKGTRPAAPADPGRVLLTCACDQWRAADLAERWVALVAGWLSHTRPLAFPDEPPGAKAPPLVDCQLQPEVDLGLFKRRMFDLLDPPEACLGPALPAAAQTLAAALNWAAPTRLPFLPGLVGLLLAEAESLGLVALGRMAEPAQRLRSGRPVADLFPAEAARVTVQADMTALVAGPPARDLAALLDGMARRESRGGATTWRFTPDTVRAALDAGADPADLLARLRAVATHGVPHALEVLIADVVRRHGQLRVAAVGCVVRAADAALAAELTAGRMLRPLQLRQVAPGVLVSSASARDTLAALRGAGYMPANEDAAGLPVVERAVQARADTGKQATGRKARSGVAPGVLATLMSDAHATPTEHAASAAKVIDRLLADKPPGEPDQDDALIIPFPRTDASSLPTGVATHLAGPDRKALAEALFSGEPVHLTYVDRAGRATARTVEELELDPPYLSGYCHLRNEERTFVLAKVISVAPARSS